MKQQATIHAYTRSGVDALFARRGYIGVAYSTRSRYSPCAGAVKPARERSRDASTAPTSSAERRPRPTSIRVPTIIRTMLCTNESAVITMSRNSPLRCNSMECKVRVVSLARDSTAQNAPKSCSPTRQAAAARMASTSSEALTWNARRACNGDGATRLRIR